MNTGTTLMLEDVTLADLMRHVEDDDGCLVWTGHASSGRFPQWRVGGKVQPARRVVYQCCKGKIKKGFFVGVNCGTDLCVHPDHVVARKRNANLKGVPLSLQHKISISVGRRAGRSITDDDVRTIRASDEDTASLALRFGISRQYVWSILRGDKRVDHASPWAGLLGMAA